MSTLFVNLKITSSGKWRNDSFVDWTTGLSILPLSVSVTGDRLWLVCRGQTAICVSGTFVCRVKREY